MLVFKYSVHTRDVTLSNDAMAAPPSHAYNTRTGRENRKLTIFFFFCFSLIPIYIYIRIITYDRRVEVYL